MMRGAETSEVERQINAERWRKRRIMRELEMQHFCCASGHINKTSKQH